MALGDPVEKLGWRIQTRGPISEKPRAYEKTILLLILPCQFFKMRLQSILPEPPGTQSQDARPDALPAIHQDIGGRAGQDQCPERHQDIASERSRRVYLSDKQVIAEGAHQDADISQQLPKREIARYFYQCLLCRLMFNHAFLPPGFANLLAKRLDADLSAKAEHHRNDEQTEVPLNHKLCSLHIPIG